VTMGFYATCEAMAPAELRQRCLTFLDQFADTRIRLATIEWLPRTGRLRVPDMIHGS